MLLLALNQTQKITASQRSNRTREIHQDTSGVTVLYSRSGFVIHEHPDSRQQTAAADLTVQSEKAVRPAERTSVCTCSFMGALEAEALKPCLTHEVFVKNQKARLRWNEKSGLV